MPKFEAIPEISAAARLMHARLAKVPVGETVTYTELSEVGRTDVRKRPWTLKTARNLVRKAEGFIFAPVHGEGLKRLDDVGIAQDVSRDRQMIHRKAIRSIRKTECVQNLAGMPEKDRLELLATASCLGAIAHAATATTVKRLTQPVQKATARLPLDETLAAMGNGKH